jgi:hypothetical protein
LYKAAGGTIVPQANDYPTDLVSYSSGDSSFTCHGLSSNAFTKVPLGKELTNRRIEHYQLEGRYGPEMQKVAQDKVDKRNKHKRAKQLQHQHVKLAAQTLADELGLF